MAKRNQVTADLRISANAQLKNSQSFIKELEKITSGFDFGNKINNQLEIAKGQLKEYNKVLSKVQNKSVVSDEELKDIVKAGKEIASLVTKTQSLYKNLNSGDLKKYSREYIAETKRIEQEVAKIKQDYTNKTGKNFDKELANYDKLSAKVRALEKEKANLMKNGATQIATKEIEQLNQKLEEQKNKLLEIKKIQQSSTNAYTSAINAESKKRGYNSYNDIKNIKIQNEDQIRKQLGNVEYKQQANIISEINREIKSIEKNKKDSNSLDKAAIELARKYKIENVSTLNSLKQQVKLKRDILNTYKNNKSGLADEKLVTSELEKQNKILEDRNAIESAGKAAELKVIQQGGYNSKASLTATGSATNRSITNIENQLTDSGIENITNNAAQLIAGQIAKLNTEIAKGNQDLATIDETNKKLATQSDRKNNEQDITSVGNSIRNQLNETEGDVNDHTTIDNDRIANNIVKLGISSQIPYGKEIKGIATNVSYADGDDDFDQLSIDLKEYDRLSDKLENAINEIKIGSGSVEEARETAENFGEVFDSIVEITLRNFQKIEDELYKDLQAGNLTEAEYQDEMERITNQKSDFNRYQMTAGNRLDSIDAALNPRLKVDPEVFGSIAKESNNASKSIARAAEQSQFLGSTFDDLRNKVGYFLSLNYLFDQMTRKVTEAVQTTKEMDKNMTQIGLVLGKTSTQVWRNFDTYSQMAERLNTTTSQVTNSMKLFYQQGLNTTEVNKMVEASAIAAALGESTLAEASETLTSILNSYSLSANDALMVTDKISQIAIVSAADFGELSTAIEKVASSAASAGLDLDHMMGYLAKMIETTREAPTNIGTALKTIVANFTQFKEDPTGLTEEGTEINKVDKALKSVGISLTDTNGEVRDLSEVLDELGQMWQNLTRNQKSYLATAIAGTRQQSRFYALMNDYDRTLELVAEGSNSAGKAQQQFALYSNSLEAATNRLTNQWEKFFNSITRGNGLISKFTNTLTGLMKIVNTLGPIGTVLGIGSLIKSTREAINTFDTLSKVVDDRKKRDSEYSTIMSDIKNSDSLTKSEKKDAYSKARSDYLKARAKDIENLNASEAKYLNTITKIEKQQQLLDSELKNSSNFVNKLKYNIGTLGNNSKKFWASFKLGASQAKAALASMMKEMALLYASMLVLKAAGAIFDGIKSALNLNTEAYIENAENARENADNINGLKDEYETLSKKINKTAEEQERLKEITEEITKIDSKLGQQLKDNADNYQANIKAMQEYADLQQKIAAQETAKAVRSEASIGKNLFLLLKGETWTNWFGSENDKNSLKSEQQTNWRELAAARGLENNLNSSQTSMLNKYTEDLIKWQEEAGWDSLTYKFNTGEFDNIITDFINNLKNLTEAQQEAYTNFVTDMNSGESTYSELMQQWYKLDVPQEVKNNLSTQLNSIMTSIKNQISGNTYIGNKDKAYNNVLTHMSVSDANNLFNPNTSTMSKSDLEVYKSDLAKFVEDTEALQKYKEAQLKGGDALKDFTNKLLDGGKYTQTFTSAIYSASQALTSEQFEKAISNILKLGDLDIQAIMKGESGQLDILQELGKGKIDFSDIIMTSDGTLSVDTSRLIAEQEANFKLIFDKLTSILDDRQKVADGLIAEDNTAIKSIIDAKTNAINNAREATRAVNNYEGGYQADWQAYKWGIWDKVDLTQEYRNKTQTELEDFINKNSYAENNDLYNDDFKSQIKGARMALAEKRGQGIVKDTSGMNEDERNKYLTESVELRNQEIAKLEKLNKNSQEYYDTTYKIKTLGDSINKALDEGAILESDKAKINGEYDGQLEKQKQLNQEISNQLTTQIDADKKRLNIIRKQIEEPLNYQKGFAGFFDGLNIDNTVINKIDAIKEAYQQLGDTITNTDELQQTLASNPQLIQALDVTSEGLTWNKQKLEELGVAALDESYNYIQSRIESMEATKATLETQSEDISGWSEEAVTQVSAVIGGNNSLINTQQQNAQNEATNLGISEQSWINWSDGVCKAIAAAGEEYNKFLNSEANKEQASYTGSYNGSKTVGSGAGGQGAATVEDKKNDIKETLKATGYSANKKGAIANINKQIELLKGIQNAQKYKKSNIGKYLGGDLYDSNGGGGKNEFGAMVEKLEHFYNYLRQIEALEAKINKIREKRNLIDATQNYYIKDLAEENKLLKEQASLYGRYINDEVSYLADLRSQLAAAYGDWVYFNDEGVVQVRQTEFNINSEAEQERYETFSELLDEYQNEYNTMLENQNQLYSIQATIVENINNSYDKVLQKLNDVTERLEYINSISEHRVNMEFGSIKKLKIMNDQIKTTADMLLYAQKSVNELEGDFNQLSKIVEESAFKSLLTWDETLQKYFVNNDALNNDNIRKQFESQGYNWEEIVTWVNATAGASQKITDSMQETNEQLMSARESLKDLLDERISTIDEIFDKATEEINKFYDIYEKKISSLGTENDLFGTKSENLEKQFDYLVITAQHAKALLNDLKENNQSILDTLMKDYGQYVDIIDGVAYINKVAIEESNTLTEGQKADLLQLYQLYYDSKDQIDEVNDKFYDYISQIKEMEETKRDAIIDLKNQLYQELLRIDQKEIDDLSEKYQKMSQLDSEYYSKLQQRINDARNARSRLQEQQNLTQMQNRLATLQQDNSGQYNSEMIELQKQINEQLQNQADQNVDLELERIAREQEQRQEDREMQITQMENLLTFKDENGIYWQETQDIIENGNASVIGKLMESEEIQKMSKEEQAKQFESLESQVETANADFTSVYQDEMGWQTSDIRQGLKDFVETPLDKIPGEISSGAGQIKEQIVNGTKTFINTMSALFKYLDELTGKTEAKGYTTGILNDNGIYTAPTKKPDPAPSVPAAPAAPPQSQPSLAKGSYVQVKSGTRWYYDSYGTNPSGRARSGTIKYINPKGSHPYNIEGLGWVKKTDIVGYNKGGYVNYTGIAAVHGKANKPEAFLNARQTALFETLRDALVKVPTSINTKETDNSETVTIENLAINVKELADTDSIDKVVRTVKESIYKDAVTGNNMKITRRR